EVERLTAMGVPEEVARAHASRYELAQAPDVIATASEVGRPVEEVARAFYVLGQRLRIDWLRAQLDSLAAPTRTQRWAVHAVLDDTWAAWSSLVRRALEESQGAPVEEAADAFVERRAVQVRRLASVTRSLRVDGSSDLPALMLAVRYLRSLA